MGGIQTEPVKEQDVPVQDKPVSPEHQVEVNALISNMEGLAAKLKAAVTYGQVRDALLAAGTEVENINNTGLHEVIASCTPQEEEVEVTPGG